MSKNGKAFFFTLFILLGLYLTSLYSYLLFHCIVEVFGIVILFSIFLIVWNSQRFLDNGYLLFLGITSFFIAVLNLVHALAYKGMGIFQGYDANLPTQLWIAGRYLQSLSLFVAPLFLGKKPRVHWIVAGYAAVTLLLLGSIFHGGIFPLCFVEGAGLTPFKKVSEYVICLIFLASLVRLIQKRREFAPDVLRLLLSYIILTIASELLFTFYLSAYGLFNLAGHFFMVGSFYLLYKAIVETGLKRPYDLLFRNLKQSEESLRRARDDLEVKVAARTEELRDANDRLRLELAERRRAEEGLRRSSEEISDLYNQAPCGYHSLDREGILIRINDTELQWLGYTREEVIGRMKFPELLTLESLKTFEENFPRLKSQGWIRDLEFDLVRKDGTILPVIVSATAIRDLEGMYLMSRSMVYDITDRKRAEKALRESEERLRYLSSQLLLAQENERKRIAGEIHDGLGQLLNIIKTRVENLFQQMDKSKESKIVEDLIPVIQESIQEARRVQMDLRPSILDDLGILPTMNWFFREFQKTYSNIRIEKEIGLEEEKVVGPLKTVIYRILQEALNNIAKHSKADLVRLSLRETQGAVELIIQDTGQGFDLEETRLVKSSRKGLGLSSMRERAELSGGSFSIESSKGAGTVIRATWPIEQLSP